MKARHSLALLPIAVMTLTGCATPRAAQDGSVVARLGQTVNPGGPRVTPLRVLEDSRCPMEARCIRAGEVRLQVRVQLGRGSELRELTLGKPEPVADGQLTLQGVMPPRSLRRTIRPGDYRFSFSFAGGL